MRIIFLITASLSLFFSQLEAQPHTEEPKPRPVRGKVVDEGGTAIPFATIAVYLSGDSTIHTGDATDIDGDFRIMLEEGAYDLEITFLSYEKKRIENVQVGPGGINLGTITLSPNTVALEEVVIAAERGQMELKLDKRVFNVEKDMTNIGGSAADILDNLPSITVDVDGNVSLRGSESVRILIDGKPSGLVGISSTDALRQLQGDIIERIEVITNPSARYDAEGQVGIINIVLKKDRRDGINGSFQLTTGYPHNHNASANINFRKKKYNLFANLGVNYRESPGMGGSVQEFFTDDTSFFFRQDREHVRGRFAQNANVGLDYFITDKDQLTISGLVRRSDGLNKTTNTYRDFNELSELTRSVVREDEEEEFSLNTELSLSYRRDFEKPEHKLTADFKLIDSRDEENSSLEEESDISTDIIEQRAGNIENERNWLLQADYILPIGEGGQFEAGWRSTLRYIKNAFTVEQLNSENVWTVVGDFDNDMRYDELIHAAYAMYGNKLNAFSYQLGLRAEHSDITTELLKTAERNPRKYTNLFPSAHFTYETANKDQWQLSYSRRISRPRFRMLLPFYSFSDNRRQWTGNPDLDPEFTSSLEAGYLKYFQKGSILSTVYYRYTTGVIERLVSVDSAGFTSVIPVNLSTENSYGFEFNISYDPFRWWNLTTNINLFQSIREGSYEGETLRAEAFSGSARLGSKWKLTDEINMQVNGNYRAPQKTTQGNRKAITTMDFAISTEVLKRRGTLAFNVSDVFNSRIWRMEQITEGYRGTSEFQWRQRQFTLSLNYRINQKPNRNSEGRGGGMDGGDMEF